MRRALILTMTTVLMMAMALAAIPASAAEEDATVVAWGFNQEGQIDVPAGLTDVDAIAAGAHHSLALKADNTVVGWGDDTEGQIAIPSGLSDVTAIGAGWSHSLAVTTGGTVEAWGYNSDGQATVPSGLTGVVAVDGGIVHSIALKTDGTVVAWGDNFNGQTVVPSGLSDAVAIAAGTWHNLALKDGGTVVAWGSNFHGESIVPEGLTNVVAVAAGSAYSLALTGDGTVVAWGDNTYHQTDVPPGLTGVIAIAAGDAHSLALTGDGTLVAWGDDSRDQAGIPAGLTDVEAIAAGSWHNLVTAVHDPTARFVTGGGWIDSPSDGFPPVGLPFHGGSYYELVPSPLTWPGADLAAGIASIDACESAHLATITSAKEQAVLSGLMAGSSVNAWIGGFQPPDALVADLGWQWVTGEAFGYTNWADDEPNDTPYGTHISGSEQHLETYLVSGLWNDAPEIEEKHYVVEYEDCSAGKATFGIMSKYQKGAMVPTGNTQFHLPGADLNFHSTNYDSMIVTVNDTVILTGLGTVNGEGAYKFQIWAGDGDPDMFRIKIWTEDQLNVETIIYDNGHDQAIGGGNIGIHTKK